MELKAQYCHVELIMLSGHTINLNFIPFSHLESLFNDLLSSKEFIRISNPDKDIAGFIRRDQIASMFTKPL